MATWGTVSESSLTGVMSVATARTPTHAYIVMAYIVMAYVVMAYIVMAYTVMALYSCGPHPKRVGAERGSGGGDAHLPQGYPSFSIFLFFFFLSPLPVPFPA